MRAWTLDNGVATSGIELSPHPPSCRGVSGQGDLGLHLTGSAIACCPVDPGAVVSGGRLTESPGDGALVLIRDHSGIDGGWNLRAAHPAERWDDMLAAERIKDAIDRVTAAEAVRSKYPDVIPRGWTELSRHTRLEGGADSRRSRVVLYGHMAEGSSFELRMRRRPVELVYGLRVRAANVILVTCRRGDVLISDPAADAAMRAALKIVRGPA